MTKTEMFIDALIAQGFSKKSILAALCDKEALKSLWLTDKDQRDIEEAFLRLKTSVDTLEGDKR